MTKRSIRWRLGVLLAAVALSGTAISAGMLSAAPPAHAASERAAGGEWSPYGGWLGNYYNSQTGTYVYCADLWADDLGSGGHGTIVDTIAAASGAALGGTREVTGAELQMLNYAVSVHGQTDDNIAAAAVAAFVWGVTSTAYYGNGDFFIAGPHAADIRQRYLEISADTVANHHLGTHGSGTLSVTANESNHYLGAIEVSGLDPAESLGTVALSNAVFADSGSPLRTGLRNGSSHEIIAVPPADGSEFRVSAEGAFSGQIPPRYEANIELHSDTGQRSIGPGGVSRVANYSLQSEDAQPRRAIFRPVLSTSVASRIVQPGEEFADVLTFTTTADDDGVNNPWYRTEAADYTPVVASATVYGPFLEQPIEADEVPEGAPVAASGIVVTTDSEHGPAIDYTVQSGFVASEPGYYNWVWSIAADQQSAQTRAFLPAGYLFRDSFGRFLESSVTPMRLVISTQLTQSEIELGGSIVDEVTISLEQGSWLQHEGAGIPATLTGVAYFSEAEPRVSADPPPSAEEFGRLSLTVSESGSYLSEAMEMPSKPGFVTFQWCLLESEQPVEHQGLIAESCDSYGQPSETVRLVVSPSLAPERPLPAVPEDPVPDPVVPDEPVPSVPHEPDPAPIEPPALPLLPETGLQNADAVLLASMALLLFGFGSVSIGLGAMRGDRRRDRCG